jgi:hypothetical protein
MAFQKAKHKIDVPCEIPELQVNNLYMESAGRKVRQGESSTPNTAGGVTCEKLARGFQLERLTLTDAEIEIDEANDYGSIKLVDLPTTNLIVAGVIVDLTCTVDGTVISDPEDIDYAVGTTAVTSTNFSNAGEKNLIAENDVAALGVMQAQVTGTEDMLFLGTGAKAVYLNIQATIGTTATQSFAGTVDIMYVDLGDS